MAAAPQELKVKIPYQPREPQRALHKAVRDGFKHVMCVFHRRTGKTVGIVNELVRGACTCPRRAPRFAYFAPFLKQAKTLAWDYLRYYTEGIPGRKVNVGELSVDFPNGGQVRLWGADNFEAARGIYLDGVVLDEFGQIPRLLRTEVLLPALADRGGYEIVSGTPKGRNQFYQLYAGDEDYVGAVNDPAWCVLIRKASETGILPRETLDELLRQMGPEQYAQELECAWNVADRGNYYAKIMERLRENRRMATDPYDAGLQVHTAWDLGIGDATAIWFVQKLGSEVRWVDYYESEGEGLAHYINTLQRKATERRFNYGKHFVPHDADHRTMQTGKTLVQMAREMNVKMDVVPVGDFEAGIEATRQILERSWFDAERCKAGIAALDAYRRKYNARMDEYSDTHEHDWASNGADAARTLAMAELGHKLSPHMFAGQRRTQFARM